MSHEIKGNKLIIEFDPNSTVESSTKQSYILASSHGFKFINGIGISYNIIKMKKPSKKGQPTIVKKDAEKIGKVMNNLHKKVDNGELKLKQSA